MDDWDPSDLPPTDLAPPESPPVPPRLRLVVLSGADRGRELELGRGAYRVGKSTQCQLQLSDELSQQAGRDLVRYTQQGGRVTLPATITGSAADPHVRLDVASLAKRAITNRANEEAQKAVKKGLGG